MVVETTLAQREFDRFFFLTYFLPFQLQFYFFHCCSILMGSIWITKFSFNSTTNAELYELI